MSVRILESLRAKGLQVKKSVGEKPVEAESLGEESVGEKHR